MTLAYGKLFNNSLPTICALSMLAAALILGVLLVPVSVSDGAAKKGSVSGKITVLEKKLFGGIKEKEDMSGALVYITGFKNRTPKEIPDIVQKNKRFEPVILPIVAGQTVRFPNQDKIYHNVFSISPVKPFDLGQYKKKDPPKSVTFENPGLVPVYCNIHPKMIAYIVVLENSAHALTNADGTFLINNLPTGTFTINAWLPKAKRVSEEIRIQPGREIEVNLEIQQILKMKSHKRKDGSRYPVRKTRRRGY